jgi:cation:H+ antiporter
MLLFCYLWGAFHWSKKELTSAMDDSDAMSENLHTGMMVLRLLLGCGLVVAASHFLIPAVETAAVRMNLPQAVISATMVAFGTSLPELVTSLKAVKKGHGEMALGNIIGANILNVLFVTGMAASLARDGLEGPEHFSRILFPAMITTLIIFGLGMHLSGQFFKKAFSIMLLGIYAVVLFSSYLGMTA